MITLHQKLYIACLNQMQITILPSTYGGTYWGSQIKQILETHGFSYLWLNQDVNSVPFLVIKQRILDIYHQTWYTDINNSSRLSTYCRFKHSFTKENYLDSIFEKKYKIVLCKFCISAHNLAIEKGRHQNIPHENRCYRSLMRLY